MKQKIVKKAALSEEKSPKIKKSRIGAKSNQTLYIKILSALLVVLALCFFAYFLTNKNDSKPILVAQKTQNIEKKDGTQKTIEDINRYLQKQEKNTKSVLSEQNLNTKKNVLASEKAEMQEPKKVENNETKVAKTDINLTTSVTNDFKKSDSDLSTEHNKTSIKQVEINATKNQHQISVFDQNLTKQEIKKPKNLPAKKEEKPIKSAEFKGKISTHDSEISAVGAKLVIIIDDVATMQHATAIKSTGLKITPSIFPATKFHPDTPQIAKGFSFYMVHLPMQAIGNSPEEIGTLKVGDSIEKIQKTLQSIKKDFPNLRHINNHTGSRFTSDFNSMDKFMSVAKRENLIFLDSKTINTTKVYEAAKKNGMRYIARDVFLDNDDSKLAIASQLKYAVKLAKQKGYAIAIGHPHKNTIEVLRNSKEILRGVEVVYLKEIL